MSGRLARVRTELEWGGRIPGCVYLCTRNLVLRRLDPCLRWNYFPKGPKLARPFPRQERVSSLIAAK